MNTRKLCAAIAAGTLLAASCDVLDQPYYMGYDADKFTNENLSQAAIGMYDAMQNQNFLGGRTQIYADIRSMNTNPSSYFGAVCTFDGSLTSGNGVVLDAYTGGYRTLFEINLFLERLASNADFAASAEGRQYLAEGKFLRAVVYFYLVNLWGDQYTQSGTGLGVPLILSSYDGVSAFTDAAKVPRSSVSQVYAQIEKDLSEALPDLPEDYDGIGGEQTQCRATKGAVYAMQSRVYLYQKKYDKVADAAYAVTALGYELDDDPASSVFVRYNSVTPKSADVIFFVAHNESDNPNTNNSLGQHYGYNYRRDITVSQNYVALFADDPDDVRAPVTAAATTAAVRASKGLVIKVGANYYCHKYPNGSYNWAPVIRYAEVLLNKAEALARQASGVSADALELVNDLRKLRKASEKTAADFADKEEFLLFILDERRRELAFEGLGFDQFRFEQGIAAGRVSASAAAVPYPSNLFALPIPEKDMAKEPGVLVQNPDY